MRRINLAGVLLAISLALGGCGHVGDVFKLATTSVENPIAGVDIYRARNVYAATLEVAVEWRTYCFGSPYRALMASPVGKRLCANRRPVARRIEALDNKAFAALAAAEAFVRDHPTINAAIIVGAAWDAVTAFKSAVPARATP